MENTEGYAQIRTQSDFYSRVHFRKVGSMYFLDWIDKDEKVNREMIHENSIVSFKTFQS